MRLSGLPKRDTSRLGLEDPPLNSNSTELGTTSLDEAKAVNSVGSKGNSYDNALAESVNSLYKAELIRRRKRWRTLGELELATAAWVHWYNTERLHGTCGDIPPAEFEEAYYRQLEEANAA